MCQLMFDSQINSIINSGVKMKGFDLLNNQPSVRSFLITDQFLSDEIYRFWMNSWNIQKSQISGSEKFSGEFLKLSSNNVLLSSEMLDLMVEYYITAYDNLEFRKPFSEGSEDIIIIQIKMNQFKRCWINSKIFGLTLSLRHVKSSYILAKFIINNRIVDCYLGQVQYYFVYTVNFSNNSYEYFLAYVYWYQPADFSNI